MTDFGRIAEVTLRLQHRHGDGSWGTMEPRPSHHDPAQHDPERAWEHGRIYVCNACDEQVRVVPEGESAVG